MAYRSLVIVLDRSVVIIIVYDMVIIRSGQGVTFASSYISSVKLVCILSRLLQNNECNYRIRKSVPVSMKQCLFLELFLY